MQAEKKKLSKRTGKFRAVESEDLDVLCSISAWRRQRCTCKFARSSSPLKPEVAAAVAASYPRLHHLHHMDRLLPVPSPH